MIFKRFRLFFKRKPYIKKIEEIGKKKVWIVNGKFVRENICEDFVNVGQHYRFNFIPKNEFWIAKEAAPGEAKFYIDYLLLENRLMKEGVGKKEAMRRASIIERRERKRSKKVFKIVKIKNHEKLVEKVHKKIIKEYNGLKIWQIKGELVRDLFEIDFAGGSHHRVDSFIPKNEIWIDDDIAKDEIKFILIHELHERYWMSKGFKYHPAHVKATKVEDYCRNHPRKTEKLIEKELERQIVY